jgi:hypothetical protein
MGEVPTSLSIRASLRRPHYNNFRALLRYRAALDRLAVARVDDNDH